MSSQELIIEGARQNNLKNISLRLPHDKVIAITGVSGSGKSSLAFDTIFAEGHWRFIESLSTYARLFLEKVDRPEVDAIVNIRPAIALEQKNPVRGSRSTVGTLTELYELFRILYAKASTPFCPRCGKEIRRWDPSAVISELLEHYQGERAVILFETVRTSADLLREGFARAWVDGGIVELSQEMGASDDGITVVLDRLVIRDEARLSDSVEAAWREGKGRLKVVLMGRREGEGEGTQGAGERPPAALSFSAENACEECGIEIPLPTPLLFSFNHPVGACPACTGFGNILRYDEDVIVPDKNLSLAKGAVDPWNKPAYRWWRRQFLKNAEKAGIDVKKPYRELTEEERALLFKGGPGFYGIDDFFEDLEDRRYKLHVRVFLSRYRRAVTCHSCGGKRLKPEALAYKIGSMDIADLCRIPLSDCLGFFLDAPISPFHRDMVREPLRQIEMKLRFLDRVGLDYLTLDRYGKTLSGGEYQRINLSNQLASLLTGTLYVLDEPTVGLHPRDTDRIARIMGQLAGLGNTVIVVEHDRGIIESADWIVELGPGGGHRGGEVVFTGPSGDFLDADTLTARYMRGDEKVAIPLGSGRRRVEKSLTVCGARGNNLKNIDFRVPLGTFTVVTGVSGSGKSSLVVETLYRGLARRFRSAEDEAPLPFDRIEGEEHLRAVRLIDQSPIGRSPRSNPVTYLKAFDHIRKVFAEQREAKAHGHGPGFFSFNVPGGRCETCKGGGYELLEMYFFEDLYITCEKCNGKRYRPEALRISYKGKSIHDVLSMTVEEAYSLFEDLPRVRAKLLLMIETGLGYLRLGQPATTLSGGEAQRLKICAEMAMPAKGSCLYILDEPTVGLHFADVQALLSVLNRLVEAGNTVLVIEHNLDVVKAADWAVDLGPEGGYKGGRILFEGPPKALAASEGSHTGRYLRGHGPDRISHEKVL